MAQKSPHGRKQRGRPRSGRSGGGRGGHDRRRRGGGPGDRRPQRGPREPRRVEMVVRGKAGDVGLDGKLRVKLEPIDLAMAERLTGRRGADVMTPRGDRIGRVETIVGTLERPTVIVKVDPDARLLASELGGREVFLG